MLKLQVGNLVHVPRWGNGVVEAVGRNENLCIVRADSGQILVRLRNGKHPTCQHISKYTATLRNVWVDGFGVAHSKEAT